MGNVGNRNAGVVLKVFINGGNIVSELVKLQQQIMHGAEVEVGGFCVGFNVVGRALNRAKIINFIFSRHNDHSARVLTRGAFHSHAAVHKTGNFGIGKVKSSFLLIFFNISVGRLVCHTGNGSGLKNVFASEKLFGVFMNLRLNLSGEVKVNIGNLVALKSEEGLKGNVVSVASHVGSAFGTIFRRQIKARAIGAVGYKLAVLAFRANIVGSERVNLGNSRHRGGKGGTDRPSRANEIAVVLGEFNQLLRRNVHNRKAVSDD